MGDEELDLINLQFFIESHKRSFRLLMRKLEYILGEDYTRENFSEEWPERDHVTFARERFTGKRSSSIVHVGFDLTEPTHFKLRYIYKNNDGEAISFDYQFSIGNKIDTVPLPIIAKNITKFLSRKTAPRKSKSRIKKKNTLEIEPD